MPYDSQKMQTMKEIKELIDILRTKAVITANDVKRIRARR